MMTNHHHPSYIQLIKILQTNKKFSIKKHLVVLRGEQVQEKYFKENGFTQPIFIPNTLGLRIKLPSSDFTLNDVKRFVGENQTVRVIDVNIQEDMEMKLGHFLREFQTQPRHRLLNVLSLEFSHTELSTIVEPPRIVKELSVTDTICHAYELHDVPSVQKYCLMSMAGSFTDFHIDFGGSSVWYHILWGKKVFYLIRPTKENLRAYERWNSLPESKSIFLLNFLKNYVDEKETNVLPVYKLEVNPGNTILLPSGWIHAVYTPVDSLVFGGNFLHVYSIPMQLKIYDIENTSKTKKRFRFPLFEKLHWILANYLHDEMHRILKYDNYQDSNNMLNMHAILDAIESLLKVLPKWLVERQKLTEIRRIYYLPQIQQEFGEQLIQQLNKFYDEGCNIVDNL